MEIRNGITSTLRFPEAGEDPVELEEPKVTIVRDSDGKTIVNEAVATKAESEEDPHWTIQVSGTDVAEADLLSVTWKDADSTFTQEVDVVGGFACSIKDIKKKLEESAEDLPEDWLIERAREEATKDLERAAWMALRHRYAREVLSGDRTTILPLDNREVVKIVAIEENEVAFDQDQIDRLAITPIGVERRIEWGLEDWTGSYWLTGVDNISIAYVYGPQSFSSARQAVIDLAADYLVQNPTNWQGRATSYTDTEGNNYRLVTAGEKGAVFNVPSANAFVKRFGTVRVA